MNKIYGIKNCGSVKKALEWFVARDLPFEFHDFRKEGIDPVLLDEWIEDLLRRAPQPQGPALAQA